MTLVALGCLLRWRNGRNGCWEICLAAKQRRHVAGCLTAGGGHVEKDETTRESVARELWDEQGVVVRPSDLVLLGIARFVFPYHEKVDLYCPVFATNRWQGEPRATAEMGPPAWYPIDQLPLARLPVGDGVWLPRMLAGERLFVTVARVINSDGQYQLLDLNITPLAWPSLTWPHMTSPHLDTDF